MKAFADNIPCIVRSSKSTSHLMQYRQSPSSGQGWSSSPQWVEAYHSPKGECPHRIPPLITHTYRWYALPLTERHCGKEIHKVLDEGLQAFESSGLPGNFKVWRFQFGILPRIFCPMQVCTITMAMVEVVGRLVSSHICRWFGVPRNLTSGALNSSSTKLTFPDMSLSRKSRQQRQGFSQWSRITVIQLFEARGLKCPQARSGRL